VPVPIYSQELSQTPPNNEQRQSFLDSLRFEQIDARQMTIKTAHAKTCRWLLKSEQYLDWLDRTKLDEHHGFLWIKGKAGTGKSTLMKYALVNARKTMKDHIIISFFFNARGDDIEKSTIGTYRSLLLQLLERLPALQSISDSLSLSTPNITADRQWNVETLKTLLEQAIQSLGDSPVVCFIDALDECGEDQVRDMIQFFEHIGDLAVSSGIRFRVCFSSRHYPYITIRHGLELVLEGQEGHSQDISNYVETELKIGKNKTAHRVRAALQQKASGIFMWVVLVVGILNKEADSGKVHTLEKKLHEIPGDLHELFRDILTRDSHDKYELVLCIQWVLFAKQPLGPEQLYHAIHAGTNPEAITEWDPEDITRDVIRLFILNCSKGLVEITVSKKQRVQFIHESVRDFLLKENGLGKIWPEFRSNFEGHSHDRLKQCCLDYISIDVATPLEIPDELPTASTQPAASLRESATQAFPFLEYAVHNVLYHANTAEGGDISQAHFLDSFPRPEWVKLNNLFEKHEVRRHTERVSLLYLLAELDMADLIGVLGLANRCMVVEPERYGCPLFAAAAMSSEKALEAFMESIEVQQAGSRLIVAAVGEQQSQRKSAQRTARRDFVYSKAKDFVHNAAELGHDGVLALLIKLGISGLDRKDSKNKTLLWWASKNGCEISARLLLTADLAMVDSKGKNGKTPMFVAVEQGHREVVELLLVNGADVNSRDEEHCSALYAAIAYGRREVATLLLERGADPNKVKRDYSTPLQAATDKGYKEIVALLLDRGANPNAQGGLYGNALHVASNKGYKEIVALLLDKSANPNAQGGLYSNALQAASNKGYKEIVALLLDRGANPNAQGGLYGNALHAASNKGYKEIVALLLDKGADANALQGDSAGGHDVRITLQEHGASG
jgi:ankyrin repeat protein